MGRSREHLGCGVREDLFDQRIEMSSVRNKVITVVVWLHPLHSARFGKISYYTQMFCVSCFLVETEEEITFPH